MAIGRRVKRGAAGQAGLLRLSPESPGKAGFDSLGILAGPVHVLCIRDTQLMPQ
jgi:hypothetical protein